MQMSLDFESPDGTGKQWMCAERVFKNHNIDLNIHRYSRDGIKRKNTRSKPPSRTFFLVLTVDSNQTKPYF